MSTNAARRVAAITRTADRLRRESVRLREQAASLGLSPESAAPTPSCRAPEESAQQVEVLRRSLLSMQARVRALEALAHAGPLPPAATAKLDAVRQEAARLWDTLRRIIREEIPDDAD